MKKGTKIVLWASVPLILLIWFAGPRIGLWGNRDGKKSRGIAATEAKGQGQIAGRGEGGQLPVTGIIIQPSYLNEGIRSAGSLLANEEVDIVSKVSGKVTGIYFREGSKVTKGDLLVKIYDDDLQAQLRRSEIQEKMLAEKLERQRVLLEKDAVSREAFDQLQTDYNVILADINLLKVRIAETEVRAPFDGEIGFRYVSEGTYVTPSVKIAHLTDVSYLKLEFAISEKYVSQNLMGKNISFQTEGYPDTFEATVYAVDYRIDETTRNIGVKTRFDNRQGRLVPGMWASLMLITEEKHDAIQVPTESIVPVMDEKRIWIARNGRADLIPITTGLRKAAEIEVLSGLNQGDTILITGLMQLRQGLPLNVNIAE